MSLTRPFQLKLFLFPKSQSLLLTHFKIACINAALILNLYNSISISFFLSLSLSLCLFVDIDIWRYCFWLVYTAPRHSTQRHWAFSTVTLSIKPYFVTLCIIDRLLCSVSLWWEVRFIYYAECHCVGCHHTECHCTECCGAFYTSSFPAQICTAFLHCLLNLT